jgi:ABC-type dipeptide/oligopeptide/nickel transport system permease component
MGWQVVNAIGKRDYYLLQATVVLAATAVVVVNLVVDVVYALLDPRVRYD